LGKVPEGGPGNCASITESNFPGSLASAGFIPNLGGERRGGGPRTSLGKFQRKPVWVFRYPGRPRLSKIAKGLHRRLRFSGKLARGLNRGF
jgi:hypothetical protein